MIYSARALLNNSHHHLLYHPYDHLSRLGAESLRPKIRNHTITNTTIKKTK